MIDQYKIIQGDCLEVLKQLEDNSIDAIITDPPYELGFMGKKWDNTGIAYNVDLWKECLRVLKPGGHLLAFSGTRTYHIMAVAIEDAGFEVRDMLEWIYASGFPKSLNVGKAVDKLQGNERIPYERPDFVARSNKTEQRKSQVICGEKGKYTKGNSQWEGFGTALKPAHEPICMARKPLSEKTIVENVLKWGCGGLDIDNCRIPCNNGVYEEKNTINRANLSSLPEDILSVEKSGRETKKEADDLREDLQSKVNERGEQPPLEGGSLGIHEGRIQTYSDETPIGGRQETSEQSELYNCAGTQIGNGKTLGEEIKENRDGSSRERGQARQQTRELENNEVGRPQQDTLEVNAENIGTGSREQRTEGTTGRFPANIICTDDAFSGSKSRYFDIDVWAEKHGLLQFPKASKRERNEGCEGLEIKQAKGGGGGIGDYLEDVNSASGKYGSEKAPAKNSHPCVKPVHIMSWLVRLVTKEGDTVLDPFAGSFTTGVACKMLGRNFMGIEMDANYCVIGKARMDAVKPPQPKLIP